MTFKAEGDPQFKYAETVENLVPIIRKYPADEEVRVQAERKAHQIAQVVAGIPHINDGRSGL